jgi:hypothetical protein
MGRTKAVTVGDGATSVRVERLNGRGVALLSILDEDDQLLRRLELPFDALAQAFNGWPAPDAPTVFLLFGGSYSEPRVGLTGLRAAFSAEVEARIAFHELRASSAGRSGWGELVLLRGRRPRRLCWFDRRDDGTGPASGKSVDPGGRGAWFASLRHGIGRSRRSGVPPAEPRP